MKYIINADDYGLNENVTFAIIESIKKNYITNSTMIVNSCYFETAVELAKKHELTNKIGLHINLTKGEPLTENIKKCKRFVDTDGRFNIQHRNRILTLSKLEKKALLEEVDAQMKRFIGAGDFLMHFDSHHHIHNVYPIYKIIRCEAKKNGFKSCRIARNMGKIPFLKRIYKRFLNWQISKDFMVTNYFGDVRDVEYLSKTKIKNSVIEIMCHPCFEGNEVRDSLDRGLIRDIKKELDF